MRTMGPEKRQSQSATLSAALRLIRMHRRMRAVDVADAMQARLATTTSAKASVRRRAVNL